MKKIIIGLSFLFLFISCEKKVFTGVAENEDVECGQLSIRSYPSGALVYIDSVNSGFKTPVDLNWMKVGHHVVELRLPLYQTAYFGTYISQNTKSIIDFNFLNDYRNYGSIDCYSQVSECDIYINDSLTNKKTNYCFEGLKPGSYKVKFTHTEHRSDSTVVVVSASQRARAELNLVDTSHIVQYTSKNSTLPSNIVNTILVDKLNQIWIGTALGVHYLTGKTWHTYNMKNSPLNTDYVSKIFVDKQNRKWIGTSKGLFLFDNGTWTDYTADVQNSNVNDIAADSTGNIWVGTYDGLCKFSDGKWQVYTASNSGIAENFVTCLTVDNKDRVWIGSPHQYLSVLDNNNWNRFKKNDILDTQYEYAQVTSLNNDFSGNIIATFLDNLCAVYNGKTWTDQSLNYGLLFVLMSYKDSNYLIFGSRMYGAKIFRSDGTKNGIGLMDGTYLTYIQCAVVDHSGNLWLGSINKGLYKFKKGSF